MAVHRVTKNKIYEESDIKNYKRANSGKTGVKCIGSLPCRNAVDFS